ncbi:MAG: DUF3540 domain-containing protein [Pseudomonadota bacterium]
MENLALKTEDIWPSLAYGRVTAKCEEDYTAITPTGPCTALLALSCVVAPEPGDRVLLSQDTGGASHILAVIDRPGGSQQGVTLGFDGPVSVDVKRGGFSVAAETDVTMTARRRITLATAGIDISADTGEVRIGTLSFLGKALTSQIKRVKMVAHAVDAIFRRSVQRMTTSYRYVEEHEEIQSASTRMLVDGTLTLQTQTTLHTAEGHIKIDAEQIHLG